MAALVGLATALWGYPAYARAERFDTLALGPELRVREHGAAVPRYELALPHGLRAPHGELVARLGVVLPTRGEALAFPLTGDAPVRAVAGQPAALRKQRRG